MKLIKIIFGMVVMILMLASINSTQAQGPTYHNKPGVKVDFAAVTKTPQGVTITLSDMLTGYAEAYKCFFTLEEGWAEGEAMNKLSATLIHRAKTTEIIYKDLQESLEELRQSVPNFSYQINRDNPRIIHIIDSRLLDQQHYGLEKTIDQINIDDTVEALIIEIGKNNIAVAPTHASFASEYKDLCSKIRVNGQGLAVRDVLSNFINLEKRNAILWIARTKIGLQETSYIHFCAKLNTDDDNNNINITDDDN